MLPHCAGGGAAISPASYIFEVDAPMELKDFVAETLVQICQGVESARNQTKSIGAKIAPTVDKDNAVVLDCFEHETANLVHFDIDIAEETKTEAGGNLKVILSVVSGGASLGKADRKNNTHHVSFDVPVVWPTSGKNKARDFYPTDHNERRPLYSLEP